MALRTKLLLKILKNRDFTDDEKVELISKLIDKETVRYIETCPFTHYPPTQPCQDIWTQPIITCDSLTNLCISSEGVTCTQKN